MGFAPNGFVGEFASSPNAHKPVLCSLLAVCGMDKVTVNWPYDRMIEVA